MNTGSKSSLIDFRTVQYLGCADIVKFGSKTLRAANGTNINTYGTISLPVKLLQKDTLNLDSENKNMIFDKEDATFSVENASVWREIDEPAICSSINQQFFITFTVVENLGVEILIGMGAMMNLGAIIDCNKRNINIQGEEIPFGWIDKIDDKPITVKQRTLLKKGFGTKVYVNTTERFDNDIFLCGE